MNTPSSTIVQRLWNCWRVFNYDELMARDKVNLDVFWLRDESLEDSSNLPNPDVLATEIVEDLRSALDQFSSVADELTMDDETAS